MEIFMILIILTLLLVPFKIKTKIVIYASREEVMDILTDFEKYIQWNPLLTSVNGDFRLYSILDVTLNMGNKRMRMHPKIIESKQYGFCWRGSLGIRYIFDGVHCFSVEKLAKNKTLFLHSEHFQGILVWPLFYMFSKTKQRFVLMNEALKVEAEGKY